MLEGRKLLITGASGYIGSWLAEYAHRDGADVRILLRRPQAHLDGWTTKFHVVYGDLMDGATLEASCRGREIVWHAASLNETACDDNVRDAVKINVLGAANVLEAIAKVGGALVLKLSTVHVYGPTHDRAATEEDAPNPLSAYARTNLMGDMICEHYQRSRGVRGIAARVANVYGAPLFKEINRWSLLVNDLCRMAFREKRIALRGTGLDRRDFVSIRDLYRAMVLVSVQKHDHTIVNIGGNNARSTLEIAELIRSVYAQRYGADVPVSTQERPGWERPGAVLCDISRLRRMGYEPKDVLSDEMNNVFNLLQSA